MPTFTDRTTAIGGLILAVLGLTAATVLALNRVIDGATTVVVILSILGLSGGTTVAAHAVSRSKNAQDDTAPERP